VKTALKSIDVDKVTEKNTLAPFHGPRCTYMAFDALCVNTTEDQKDHG